MVAVLLTATLVTAAPASAGSDSSAGGAAGVTASSFAWQSLSAFWRGIWNRGGNNDAGRGRETTEPNPQPPAESTPPPSTGGSPQPRGEVIWSADHETGDVSQWSNGQGGQAVFNNGSGRVDASRDVARSGSVSLRLSTNPPDGQAHGARIFRWANQHREAYYSTWLYFPERYHSMDWFNVFQFKSRGNQSDTAWVLNVGNRSDGQMRFYWWDGITRRGYGQALVDLAIPVGRWVHIEVFYKASGGNDGQVIMWQDGEKLYEINGVRTLVRNDDQVHFGLASYTDRISPKPAVVYADDAAISTARLGP